MADKTTGELQVVSVSDLAAATDIYDDFKMPGEFQNEAVHITGAQMKNYAVAAGVKASEVFADSVKSEALAAAASKEAAAASAKSASSYAASAAAAVTSADEKANKAAGYAGKAESASTFAQSALTAVENAIENIPSGSTVVINDLTTGGTKAALSAEMGKELNTKIKGYTYTNLSDIGLSDADMSATDFQANIAAIMAALPNSTVVFNPVVTTNLNASLRAKLNEDLNLGVQTSNVRMRLTRYGGRTVPGKIEAVVDHTNVKQIFTAMVDVASDTTYLRPFIVSYDSAGFLKQNGGKITGDLEVEKGNPKVSFIDTADEISAVSAVFNGDYVVQIKKDAEGSSFRQLKFSPYLAPESGDETSTPIQNALKIYSNEAEASGTFYLYGAHNKPTGSYKGTSSAEPQTIDIGAVGDVLLVWNNGGDKLSIVTPRGAICKTGSSISGIPQEECSYKGGVLTLATTNNFLNSKSYSYTYRAL